MYSGIYSLLPYDCHALTFLWNCFSRKETTRCAECWHGGGPAHNAQARSILASRGFTGAILKRNWNASPLDLFILLTNSRSWTLLEKLPIVKPLKYFPAFYENRRFITAFTRALYLSLSWARSIQSIPSHPISLRSNLILSTHIRLGLPSGLFHFAFPTNILHAFLFSPFVLHALLISSFLTSVHFATCPNVSVSLFRLCGRMPWTTIIILVLKSGPLPSGIQVFWVCSPCSTSMLPNYGIIQSVMFSILMLFLSSWQQ
jgi:hypothetical protein